MAVHGMNILVNMHLKMKILIVWNVLLKMIAHLIKIM